MVLKKPGTWLRRSALRRTIFPLLSTPCSWKTFFAISRPIVAISGMMCGSSPVLQHAYSGTSDAGGGRHPRHQLNGCRPRFVSFSPTVVTDFQWIGAERDDLRQPLFA